MCRRSFENLLGMDTLPNLIDIIEKSPKLHKFQSNLTAVKILLITLPERFKASFTPQYPLKGGHQEITQAIQKLLKEDIIEVGRSHTYNSPVWPVKKPNGTHRITTDYRNLNKCSLTMDGTLPDASKVINVIQRDNPKFMAAIGLSDMFFAIPIQEDSRPITTFTWQGKQYQFKRLPQNIRIHLQLPVQS